MKVNQYCFNELEMYNIIVSFKKRTYSIIISQENMHNILLNLKGNRYFEMDYSINTNQLDNRKHSKVSTLVCDTVYEKIDKMESYKQPTKNFPEHINKAKLSSDLYMSIMKNIRSELF